MSSFKGTRVGNEDDRRLVVAVQAGVRDRATARLRPRSLDRALADGAPSEATPALALRARRLIALPHRRTLAEAYRRIVRQAHQPGGSSRLGVSPRRGRVTTASDELTRLADSLTQTTPVAARGVAEALLLLADGTGPLYNARSTSSLRDRVTRAIGDLELPARQ